MILFVNNATHKHNWSGPGEFLQPSDLAWGVMLSQHSVHPRVCRVHWQPYERSDAVTMTGAAVWIQGVPDFNVIHWIAGVVPS